MNPDDLNEGGRPSGLTALSKSKNASRSSHTSGLTALSKSKNASRSSHTSGLMTLNKSKNPDEFRRRIPSISRFILKG
jgi:hypothetical protein